MIAEIIAEIKNTPFYQERFDNFLKKSIQTIFTIKSEKLAEREFSLKELIEMANIFSLSEDRNDLKSAYLMAMYSWINHYSDNPEIQEPVNLILSRLSNFPAKQLLLKRTEELKKQGIVPHKNSSLFVGLENIGREFSHRVVFFDNLILTEFQKTLWDCLESNISVSFSAPTSAGKSFILKMFAVKKIKENDAFSILYLLPSRALINEATYDIQSLLKEHMLMDEVLMTSIPVGKIKSKKVIYILTQERASVLLEQSPDILFDLIIVDEAQAISNRQRGIILQNILQDILEKNLSTPVVFSSPFIKNPDFFEKIYQRGIKNIPDKVSNVIQNLISVDVEDNKVKMRLLGDREIDLGELQSSQNESNLPQKKNRLAFLAKELTAIGDKSIIYANGPAEAEDIAQILYDFLEPVEMSENLKEMAKYIKSHLHTEFSLALFLDRGVAFHYGDLPSNIRIGLEDEFKNAGGKIRYIVCTSTLLEGVNMPAKNIFIENPHKGKEYDEITLSKHEFWNLAGRAGRLTKDFYGNVFLINYRNWKDDPIKGDKERVVKSALYSTIFERYDEMKSYLESKKIGNEDFGAVESSINKLFSEYKKGSLNSFLQRSSQRISAERQLELSSLLEKIDNEITIPIEILKKNPHVSIISQQQLFNYFLKKSKKNELDGCEPEHPYKKNKQNLERIFYRINNHFFPEEVRDATRKRIRGILVNALLWMQGFPISMMISNYVDYRKKLTKKSPNINSCVRHVLEQIEKDIRFKFAIRTKCYLDLLTYCWEINGVKKELVPIHLFLEMGACNQTMISLMGIGISRPTAKELEDKIANKEMNEEGVYQWLKHNKNNLVPFGISGVALKEVQKII